MKQMPPRVARRNRRTAWEREEGLKGLAHDAHMLNAEDITKSQKAFRDLVVRKRREAPEATANGQRSGLGSRLALKVASGR